MGIVERGRAYVHHHVGGCGDVLAGGSDHRAVARHNSGYFVLIVGGVADEIGSRIGFGQVGFARASSFCMVSSDSDFGALGPPALAASASDSPKGSAMR